MKSIKNTKFDVKFDTKYQPIVLSCKSYSKLLDINLNLSHSGLKLDVSYLEYIDIVDTSNVNKKFSFLIKKIGESIKEEGYIFFKLKEILVWDTIERYYIFFKEESPNDEIRQNKLDDLGV